MKKILVVKANYFNYGIDSNFYLSYVKESSNNLKNEINYSSKPYILFVGGAYRDKNLISHTLNFLESCVDYCIYFFLNLYF